MTSSKNSHRAIISIGTYGKNNSRINYSRRMYAIIRKYTPDVVEGNMNECLADLTGLRTFFKMTYAEIAEKIKKDLTREIGIRFTLKVSTTTAFDSVKNKSKKPQSISTYKEINKLFAGSNFITTKNVLGFKRKLSVPFIGKVS
ncbi:TPA: hypothetical protein DEP94_00685 [Candidatus Nomurabacteria bacterium]|nr:hypothetical protein [Candidatus Nomurabacteria bacterium]